MTLYRIQRTTLVTLSITLKSDEGPVNAAGDVTATLKRLDGTVVAGPTVAGHPGSTGLYTYTPPAQPLVDDLRLEWSGSVAGANVVLTDQVEIVGGFYFGISEVRGEHAFLTDVNKYSTDRLADTRIRVEQEIDRICRQAFVPRFHREALSGRGTSWLVTRWPVLRVLRAVTVDGVVWSAGDVAAVGLSEWGDFRGPDRGILTRPGGAVWPVGHRNIVVEYEHGWDYPTEEIRTAGMRLERDRVSLNTTGIPDRAISYTTQEGNFVRVSTPGQRRTGIPDVDGPLEGYHRQPRSVVA